LKQNASFPPLAIAKNGNGNTPKLKLWETKALQSNRAKPKSKAKDFQKHKPPNEARKPLGLPYQIRLGQGFQGKGVFSY
jgi:hypothetical protein